MTSRFHRQAALVSCAAVVHIHVYISKNRYNHDLQITIIFLWIIFIENAFRQVLKNLENDSQTPWWRSEVLPSTHRIIRNFLSKSTYGKMSIHKGDQTETDSREVLTPSSQFIMRGINLPHLYSFEPSDHPKNSSYEHQMSICYQLMEFCVDFWIWNCSHRVER